MGFESKRSSFSSGNRGRISNRASRSGLLAPYLRKLAFEPLEDRRLLSGHSLAASALVEGPAAGSDSDLVTFAGAWTSKANASWLHTTSSGNGNGLANFNFDANTGATRIGTLTIAGATLTVTQAGSGYVAAGAIALPGLTDVAIGAFGNVYVAVGNTIQEWNATTKKLITLVSSGLNGPESLAVDGSGNVFIADENTIKKWNAATKTLSTLVSSGLGDPVAIAADAVGNLYIADPGDNAVKVWNATAHTLGTLLANGLNDPQSVAVDKAGNVYVGDSGDNSIGEWNAATKKFTTLFTTAVDNTLCPDLTVDRSGNVYYITHYDYSRNPGTVINPIGNALNEWNVVTHTTVSLVTGFLPFYGLDSTGGVAVDGAGSVYFADSQANEIMEWNAATQATNPLTPVGLYNPRGPAVDDAGNVFVADSGENEVAGVSAIKEWNAATQTLSTLVSSGLDDPTGAAVDAMGNVYIADGGPIVLSGGASQNAIKEWNAATRKLSTLVSPVTTVQYDSFSMAVDESGNIYFIDTEAGKLEEWSAATRTVSTLVSSGLTFPTFVFVDATGNIYITQSDSTIEEWNAATRTLSTPAPLSVPAGAVPDTAVDASGNLYTIDSINSQIVETPRAYVSGSAINEGAAAGSDALAVVLPVGDPLTGFFAPQSSASWLTVGSVSGGKVNFSFSENTGAARTGYLTVLGDQIAVTQAQILATTTLAETAAAGSGSDAVNFAGPWTATSNAPWLHTTAHGSGNGTATFTFDANIGPQRTGTLTIAGQTLTLIQGAGLGATVLLEGPAAGTDSDVVSYAGPWTATANAPWLHTSAAGSRSGLAKFTFDANAGAARTGTLTIAGNILTVTQAGSGYVAAGALTTVVPSPLVEPEGVAVDRSGNVYVADTGNNVIKEWNPATKAVSTIVSSGLNDPEGIAVDATGNVYIADTGNNRIEEWNATTQSVSTLISSGVNSPDAIAVDTAGNVFVVDYANKAIKEWTPATKTVSSLAFSGTYFTPQGVAVDAAGNVYTADVGYDTIDEWHAATQTSTTLGSAMFTTNISDRFGMAVDGSGNVYFLQTYNNVIKEWNAATQTVSTVVSSGTAEPYGIAADGAGNLYIADTYDNALKKWSPSTQTLSTLLASAAGVPSGLAVDGADNVYILGLSAAQGEINEWKAATQTVGSLVTSGLNFAPSGVSVDGAGNVYVADGVDKNLKEWNAATQTLGNLGLSGSSLPSGVAVDAAGNVYVTGTYENIESEAPAISTFSEWNAATRTFNYLNASELSFPGGVAVDASGNAYIADTGNGAIREWNATTGTVSTIVSSGLNGPKGIAVDGSGNIYITDYSNNPIKEWNAATQTLSTLVSSGVSFSTSVAADTAGNLYFIAANDAIKELPRAFVPGGPINEGAAAGSGAITALLTANQSLTGDFAPSSDQSWLTIGSVSSGAVNFSFTANTGPTSRTAHITLLGRQLTVTQAWHLATNTLAEGAAAGSDSVAVSFTGPWTATANTSWLHTSSSGNSNGRATFTFDANMGAARTGTLTIAGETLTVSQAAALGASALVEGPAPGSGSVVVGFAGAWTATASVPWLHTTSSGSGYGLATFTFDANTGTTRTGTLTIGGASLTVTQAGGSYVSANPLTNLVSSSLADPDGVAVDSSGNVYIADAATSSIKEWNAAKQTLSSLVSSGLSDPEALAVDASGNIYIADSGDNAIAEWNTATNALSTLVSSGLNGPAGVAVDGAGNVYIADSGNNAIEEWNPATRSLDIVASSGLNGPAGVAVDGAGNVYIADSGNNAIEEWNPATHSLSTLVSSGLNKPAEIAVDGSGNVYIADSGDNAIAEWNAATHTLGTLVSSGLNGPAGVAVDGAGNVYIADSGNKTIEEMPRAFVPSAVNERNPAGSDALAVLPSSAPLTGLFAPAGDQGWLPLGSVTGGLVKFSFTANPGPASRAAHITLLGQRVTVTQMGALAADTLVESKVAGNDTDFVNFAGAWTATANATWLHTSSHGNGPSMATFSFDANQGAPRTGTLTIAGQTLTVIQPGTSAVVEGPAAGSDSKLVASAGTWMATANVPWLHSASVGSGDGLAIFTFDANPGATRSGTLTIAGSTLMVTQAGSSYVAASPMTTLISTGLGEPQGLQVDSAGNIYFADSGNSAIKKWNAATQAVTTLVSSGLYSPFGLAVDGAGNVYIADTYSNSLKEWNPATQTVSTLVSSGLSAPAGMAVDASGNVYIADSADNAIKEWNAATKILSTVVSSGLSGPEGVAVDASGNIYISDYSDNAIKAWVPATQTLSTLVSSGLKNPEGVAVDGSGNVYIADTGDNAIKEWNAATGVVSTLVSEGLYYPNGVAVDAAGNLYITDTANSALKELPRAFVATGAVSESAAAGSSSLPAVLPAAESVTGVNAPTSDASWLRIGSFSGGVIKFSFSQNNGSARTAHITVLGQQIALTQAQPTLLVSVNPVNIFFGTPLSNSQLSGQAVSSVNGKTVSVPGTFAYSSAAGVVLQPGSWQTENVTFTPSDKVDYVAVTTSVIVNVLLLRPAPTIKTSPATASVATSPGLAERALVPAASAAVDAVLRQALPGAAVLGPSLPGSWDLLAADQLSSQKLSMVAADHVFASYGQ